METKSEMAQQEKANLIRRLLARLSLVPLFIIVFTLLPSGTIYYWEAYLYFSILVIPMLFVLVYFLKLVFRQRNPH